jgi:predicted metal-dependent hydrolase
MTTDAPTSRLVVRRMSFAFDGGVERHWCGGDPVRTHVFNAMTLIFPRLEQSLIRAAKASQSTISDRALLSSLRAFIGQEAQHHAQHLKFFENLGNAGYSVDRFLVFVDWLLTRLERRSNLVALGAAGEHFTATGAEQILRSDLLADADPEMRALFEWHFAEEIEHKSVLYDVMVANAVGAATRWWAWLCANVAVFVTLNVGLFMLLHQDGSLKKAATWKNLARTYFGKGSVVRRVLAAAPRFLAPGFHPDQIDNYPLAQAVFASVASRVSRSA